MSRDGSDSHNRIEIKWFRNQPRCNKLSRFNALIYASIWRGKLQEKIDVLSDIMDSDIIETPLILNIIHSNIVASSKFIELVTLMCRDKNILILDEPEFGLGGAEKCRLLDFINFVNPLYKEIYVSTHYESMIGLPNTRYYTVNMHENSSDLEITEISMESANEIMD